ncbi:hypothetical protein [Motilibacter deserti]|uniref:Secreted protein n=1 Tax=Motilibacter deserti TaxID=2714956 RepID=A0ABX0GQQ1_9ACTN|nr:hypothetical protein [Motilibacter deserti]NHC12204.1 hypothetical protein [Motilibacter deserti]
MDDSAQTLPTGSAVDRRTMLKRAGALGVAAVWATPVLQSTGVAYAVGSPPPGGTPVPPGGINQLPLRGVLVVRFDGSPDRVALSIYNGGSTLDRTINNEDSTFITSKIGTWRDASSAERSRFTTFGATTYAGSAALFVTLPAGVAFVDGVTYTFDGSFYNCGDGDKYTTAYRSGSTVYFVRACNESSGGES